MFVASREGSSFLLVCDACVRLNGAASGADAAKRSLPCTAPSLRVSGFHLTLEYF